MMARAKQGAEKRVDAELLARALAKAVSEGDIVNLRLLFQSFSPARANSSERFEDAKYAYLQPDAQLEQSPRFREALAAVKEGSTWAHIQQELEAKRPAQLPAELVLRLGDNGARLGKYAAAAQAYELLRVRPKMQAMVLEEADRALDAEDIGRAVSGYRVAVGLAYDYAAFPEPLPSVPTYATQALALHAVYPRRPEESLATLPDDAQLDLALAYLLNDNEMAARLRPRPQAQQLAFIERYVRTIDPEWDAFVQQYSSACDLISQFGDRVRQQRMPAETGATLVEEIEQLEESNPRDISARLLGRMLEPGHWWQYMKELAYAHPASVLFVARQVVGEDEIVMPRYRGGSALGRRLGLVREKDGAAKEVPA
jgi:hypothetical protein